MRLKAVIFGIALLLVIGGIRSHLAVQREIWRQKATGLGAVTENVGWDPASLWRQQSISGVLKDASAGVVGGVPGGAPRSARVRSTAMMTHSKATEPDDERKVIRTASLGLIVTDVRDAVSKVTNLTASLKGGVDSSTVEGSDGNSARMKVRVPDLQLDAAIQEIRQIASKVENETNEARDVTREYVDTGARLRNLHSEEQQYLQILRRASTVEDTLEVSEKLTDVRGRIEQLQAQLNTMNHEIEMSTVNIAIIRQSDMQVLGIEWRPLYNAKVAGREVLVGFGDWFDSIVALLLNIPLIGVWLATAVGMIVACMKIGKWLLNILFPNVRWIWRSKSPEPASTQDS